jgi:putative ABC transport system substrate-binding protein
VAGVGATAAWPLAARAQQPAKIVRVGILIDGVPADTIHARLAFLREEFAKHGYVEGQAIAFEERGSQGAPDTLAAQAAELVALKCEVIVAIATGAARAAQHATTTIPIVVGSVGDPVADGLAASLSHPGGNITGTTFLGPELVPKRFGLLKELLPAASRIAVLWNPKAFSEQTTAAMVDQAAESAKALSLQLRYVDVPSLDAFESAFAAAAKEHPDAVFQFPNTTFFVNRKRLVDVAAQYRLPVVYNAKEFVEVGGLIGYGPSPLALNRRTVIFVDKILKGAKPADLPIEQPTSFDLAINLKTAKSLGLTVPQLLLAQANEIIE